MVCIFTLRSCRLDWIVQIKFGLRLDIRSNLGLILKIRPNACRHSKNLCKLGLRPKFGLRTKSDLFYQVTHCLSITENSISAIYHWQTSNRNCHKLWKSNKCGIYLLPTSKTTCNHYGKVLRWKLTCDGQSSYKVPELCQRAEPTHDAARSQTQHASVEPQTAWRTPCQTWEQNLQASAEKCMLATRRSPANICSSKLVMLLETQTINHLRHRWYRGFHLLWVGTDLIHDFTAVTFSMKLAFFREKRPFPCFREIRDFS